jgi:serine/threonine protein kinase
MVESTTRSNKDGTPVTTLKLIDFGASKFKKAQGNLELHIPCVALTSNFGTANYMSQEQLASFVSSL